MKKLLITVLAAVSLAGCVGDTTGLTEEEIIQREQEAQQKRELIVNLAVQRIEAFNAQGFDPIQLDPAYLLALDTACVTVQVLGIEVGLSEDVIANIGAACIPIQKAAASATVAASE